MNYREILDIHNKYNKFIEINKSKVEEFLTNVPFNELENTIKKKLQIDNLELKPTIKNSTRNQFNVGLDIISNDLSKNSEFLNYMFSQAVIGTYNAKIIAYTIDGKVIHDVEFFYRNEDFNIEDKVIFNIELKLCLHASVHVGGGISVSFCDATYYGYNDVWDIDFYKEY